MRILYAIAVIVLFMQFAAAHSWYPNECCGDKDCSMLPSERVQVTSSGYVIDRGWHVPFSQAKTSPDENYHACIAQAAVKCFWAPRGMM